VVPVVAAIPLPERLVGAAPEAVLEAVLDGWSVVEGAFPDEVRAEYRRALLPARSSALWALSRRSRDGVGAS
jgi:hypothetical protein